MIILAFSVNFPAPWNVPTLGTEKGIHVKIYRKPFSIHTKTGVVNTCFETIQLVVQTFTMSRKVIHAVLIFPSKA